MPVLIIKRKYRDIFELCTYIRCINIREYKFVHFRYVSQFMNSKTFKIISESKKETKIADAEVAVK